MFSQDFDSPILSVSACPHPPIFTEGLLRSEHVCKLGRQQTKKTGKCLLSGMDMPGRLSFQVAMASVPLAHTAPIPPSAGPFAGHRETGHAPCLQVRWNRIPGEPSHVPASCGLMVMVQLTIAPVPPG